MEGEVIYLIIALGQYRILPLAEGGHVQAGAAAGHQLDGRIHHFHDPAGLCGQSSVLVRGFVAHLPRAVHFIAQAPELDIMGIFTAMAFAQITVIAAALQVTVFYDIFGILHAAGAQIDGHHGGGTRFFRPVHKLIEAECIGLDHIPGQLDLLGPFLPGPTPSSQW